MDGRGGGFPVCLFNLQLRGALRSSALGTGHAGVFQRPFNAGRYPHKPGDPRRILLEIAGLLGRALMRGGYEEYWPQYQDQIYAEQQRKSRWARRTHAVGEGRHPAPDGRQAQQLPLSVSIEPSLDHSF